MPRIESKSDARCRLLLQDAHFSKSSKEAIMHIESYVYLLTNKHNNVLYIGVTTDLIRRIYEHKDKLIKGFSQKYNVDRLVYYEACTNIVDAIRREKQLKGWTRKRKDALVDILNPKWDDLYQSLC